MDPSLRWDDDLKGLRLKLVVPAQAGTHARAGTQSYAQQAITQP